MTRMRGVFSTLRRTTGLGSSSSARVVFLTFILLLLLLVLEVDYTNAQQQEQDEDETNTACPIYRKFDFENPTSNQYLAPNGCRCIDGMSDLHCHYCTSNKGCQEVNGENYVCNRGSVFNEGDTYRSYKCKLTNTLDALFNGGKTSFFANITHGTAHLSVYNTDSINQKHAIDCDMSGCNYKVGATGIKCDHIVCKCTDYCSDFTKSVIEGTMSAGNPGEFIVDDDADPYSSLVTLKVEGAPLDIQSLCNASSCSLADETDTTTTSTTDPDNDDGDEWTFSSATFSWIVLSVLTGVFLLLSLCACIPYVTQRNLQKRSATATGSGTSHADYSYGRQSTELRGGTLQQVLEFRHISRTVILRPDAAKAYGQKEKQILNNVSGSMESGTVTAIMGPSGAGKSTLLNILAAVGQQQHQGLGSSASSRISGQILLNGKQQTSGYRKRVAYVQQDDSLYETLTVQECVEYSAMLRLPKDMDVAEKQSYVSKTLEELRLSDIATNRIGGAVGGGNAGVSGGERKRVSIGMELVSQASVLVLDEPTSGLDSFAANQIVNLLSELSSRNRIVILSIHQPSMKSFMTFDRVLLLGGGGVMYNGKPSEVEKYFEDNGFKRPTLETVADHMLDVVSDKANCDVLKGPDTQRGDYEKLAAGLTTMPTATEEDDDEDEASGGARNYNDGIERRPLLNEITILFSRTAKNIFRNRELFVMQLMISVVLALFAGGIFNDVSDNLAGFQNRSGAFYFSLSFFGFASFSSMDIFVRERHIFVRETGSKYFRAFSYFLAKTVLDMFALRVVPVSIFSFIFYWMMGLKNSPEAFVVFWATMVLFNVCAGIMSICISIATPTVGQANLIAAVWFLIMLLFGGFLVNVDSMEWWYAWLKYTSIFYYSFEILMTNELSGLLLSFDAPGYPALPIYGEVFLKTIGMDAANQTRDLICLCCLAAGFAMVAYLLLLLRVPPSAGRQFQWMENENKRLCRTLGCTNSE